MYVYFLPRGGFNDMLSNIKNLIDYCKKNNRSLLIDTTKSCYRINFSDFFSFRDISVPIIADVNIISHIIADISLTIYPTSITDRNLDNWQIVQSELFFTNTLNGTVLKLPDECNQDIVVYSRCGGGKGITLFRNLYFNQEIIDHVKHEFAKLPTSYLAIQIRNTDRKCDYESLYKTNKTLIHSHDTIYIATDDKESLDFFRSNGLNIVNFTTFSDTKRNLHYSSVPSDIKIKNLICDIYIMCMADTLVSSSVGGFIGLIRDIRNDKSVIIEKIK